MSSLSVLDALEQPFGAGGELIDGAGKQVAQVALDVRPPALGGVEFGSVGRQLAHGQPVVVRLAEPAHHRAAVHVLIVTGVTNARTEAANTSIKHVKRT